MKNIFKQLFPNEINNSFKGSKIALYVFYVITAVTIWRSQHHLFSADGGAQSIATIPLDSYSDNAALTIIGIFSLWGLSQLIVGIIYLIVAIRYKSLIPLMYLLLLFEYLIRATYIPANKPIPLEGTAPGGVMNWPIVIIALVMFGLSVWGKDSSEMKILKNTKKG